jgi:hypothetical protein
MCCDEQQNSRADQQAAKGERDVHRPPVPLARPVLCLKFSDSLCDNRVNNPSGQPAFHSSFNSLGHSDPSRTESQLQTPQASGVPHLTIIERISKR